MKQTDNLSDTRGNALGIRIFLFLLKWIGINRTCELVWPVALFYALFDRRAAVATAPYIRHRFPDAGRLGRFYHRWAIYVSQGQALIERVAERRGFIRWNAENQELSDRMMAHPDGFLILTSHFGVWHSLMGFLDDSTHPVNIMMKPDRNIHVDKTGRSIGLPVNGNIISTLSPMGGLPEAFEALERRELVCIMGDRCFEDRGIPVRFLGEDALFPTAAFFLAARTRSPILPLFGFRTHRHRTLTASYGPLLHPEMKGRSRESLRPWIEQYVRRLEELAQRYPHQCFIFEDIWNKKPIEKNPHGDTLTGDKTEQGRFD